MVATDANAGPAIGAETSRYAKWAIALFFVTLCIPGSLNIGIRMTPYRFYLIAMAVPMILRFREDRTLRITAVDVVFFLAIFWRSLSLLVNHQTSEILNAGSSFLEIFFGYMLGRVFIRGAADYRYFFKCFLITLVFFLPFALGELIFRQRFLRNLAGLVLTNEPIDASGSSVRYGFLRVRVSFDHAILFGNFCAIGFVNMFYLFRDEFFVKYLRMAFVGAMAVLSLSSSAVLILFLQSGLIFYERVMRFLPYRWVLMALGAVTVWFSFQLVFSMSIPEYIATELVYSSASGTARIDQLRFGLLEIYRNPIFGIGLRPYAHAFWRSDSVDSFYLWLAMKSGVPALIFFVVALVLHFLNISFARLANKDEESIRIGYQIGLLCQLLAIGVVFIWGIANVFVMMYIGAGAWFYNSIRPGPLTFQQQLTQRRAAGLAAAQAGARRQGFTDGRRPVEWRGGRERGPERR